MSFEYARPDIVDGADEHVGVEGFAAFTPVTLAPRVDFVFSTPPLFLESSVPRTLAPFDAGTFPEGSVGIQKGSKSTTVQDSANFLLATPDLGFQGLQRAFWSGS
jgi:hypothetical protein